MLEENWSIFQTLVLNILYLSRQLSEQLQSEAEYLKSIRQIASIDDCTLKKKHLLSQLEVANQRISQVLEIERLPNNQTGIEAYFKKASEQGFDVIDTVNSWYQIKLICSECRDLNEKNGASIELLTIHSKRCLDILKGKTTDPNTYGKDGVTRSDPLSHTLTYYL